VPVEWGEWGIYSQEAQQMVFPVQFCEAMTAFALAGLAMYMNKKKKYVSDSRTYFVMLVPYGLTRFLWEFLADNEMPDENGANQP
jgi:prolipoprotein diacylglyceryltransferase